MKIHIALLLPLLLSMTLQAQHPADDERVVALLSGCKSPGDEEIIASLGIDSLEFLLTRLKGEHENFVPIYSRLIGLKYRQFSKDLTSEKKTEIMTTLCAKIGAIKDEGQSAYLIQESLRQLQGINHPAVLQLIDSYLKSDVEWTRIAAQSLKDSLKSTTMEPEEDETEVSNLIQAPREFSVGMTERELADQIEGLFPGPPISRGDDGVSFKTFIEIEGMGSPGHRSFYYLFENDELQGVIRTTSLLGLDEDDAMRIAASNYRRVLEVVTSQPVKSEILRKDGERFAKVTLERWGIDDPSVDVFHVATNYESSVGVLSSDTHFPTDQLFVSAEDHRFEGQIVDDADIIDTPRAELQKTADPGFDVRPREGRKLEPFSSGESARHREVRSDANPTEGAEVSDEDSPHYLMWSLIVIALFVGLCVVRRIRPGKG